MSSGKVSDAGPEMELQLLLEAIYRKYHYDFRDYSRASLSRRLGQACARFQCRSLSALQDRVLYEPDVFSALLDSLTVQVSEMFRDPGYFRALRQSVIPVLRTYPSVKVWVAGCSTGEEAYSIAITLQEEGLFERSTIYATDINVHALKRAEDGIYDIGRIAGFSKNYQQTTPRSSFSDYFSASYGAAIFDKALRRNMVFADHSLATDHVFSEVHLVSCRNVLIYFGRELQSRALGLFHDALCNRGFLGLGAKESLRVSGWAAQFEEVSRDKIYQKK
jgi:chemotaxis protein methyltransferase CheR